MSDPARSLWERLQFLLSEEAKATDFNQKFFLKKEIEETEKNLKNLRDPYFQNPIALKAGNKLGNGRWVLRGPRPLKKDRHYIIWLALDTTCDREVAIKIFLCRIPMEKRCNALSADAANSHFMHPNIVSTYYTWSTLDGVFHVVMEHLPNGSVRENLEQMHMCQIINMVEDIGNALRSLHKFGFFHADVKLENIFLTMDGRFKISNPLHQQEFWLRDPCQDTASFQKYDLFEFGILVVSCLAGCDLHNASIETISNKIDSMDIDVAIKNILHNLLVSREKNPYHCIELLSDDFRDAFLTNNSQARKMKKNEIIIFGFQVFSLIISALLLLSAVVLLLGGV